MLAETCSCNNNNNNKKSTIKRVVLDDLIAPIPVELSGGCKAAAVILHPPQCNFIFCQKNTLSVFNPLKAETHLFTV
jgi:ABC-type uncharacterized transport system YnjBCD ATPase subunit